MAKPKFKIKLTIGPVRLSYPHLLAPSINEKNEEWYEATCLIPKSDSATVAKLQEAIKSLKEKEAQFYGGTLPAGWKNPVKDGDKTDPESGQPIAKGRYKGYYFFRTRSKMQPAVLDGTVAPAIVNGKPKRPVITDATKVYGGCWVYIDAQLCDFTFNEQSRGGSIYLNSVLKYRDDEPLAEGYDVDSAYDDIPVAPATEDFDPFS